MSCCGKQRQAMRAPRHAPRAQPEPPGPALLNPVPLHHTGAYSLVVKGAVTGQTYLFGFRAVDLAVDERDVPALIATGRFAPAAIED
jgi:hypothetical protein